MLRCMKSGVHHDVHIQPPEAVLAVADACTKLSVE
ncbi:hypothetical protein R54767_05136 [Paraburkholderia gardini]|uniref:Uncharacterized protein n=1 Tax=Paraburkholderia gardini TaxID=2823469 RepID=A0ABM8UB14_9BURK|nr:hypothetical protein R54767_05136 [Paraburkholderia gardini]